MMAKRTAKGSVFLVAALATLVVAVGYTDGDDIQKVVFDEVLKAKAKAPGLIRLLFHDCFVRGCDASVLLLETPTNAAGQTEKDSGFNTGLRGMDVIDAIRERLFKAGTNISCADTIVFAAREAANVLSNGNIKYPVDGPNRKDGIVSSVTEPDQSLPSPSSDFTQLVTLFDKKGLNVTDLVALSSAHCIGVFHQTPIVSSNASKTASTYAAAVALEMPRSPEGVKINVRDMEDDAKTLSLYKPDGVSMFPKNVLDNSYFNAVLQNMVPFDSDGQLTKNGDALKLLMQYKKDAKLWKIAFQAAMTKLSNSDALKAKGPLYEEGYRMKCNATNYDSYPRPKR